MSMEKITRDSPEAQSTDLVAENIEKLKTLFPELITEGPDGLSVNVDVLKQLVGDCSVTNCDEKYGLNWFGKRRARQLALTPSTGTLRPASEESEDWDATQNLFIEGDNLEVLKLLQKSYAGKVKLIYIDPPYNTGKDFVYKDDFRDNIRNYKKLTGQVDEEGSPLTTNTEASGRFHTDWLNMMYPRLMLSRNLLKKEGLIFVSIDDRELANIEKLLDEVFGNENQVCTFIWKSKSGGANDSRAVAIDHEYLVCYAKSKEDAVIHNDPYGEASTAYPYQDEKGEYSLERLDKQNLQYSPSLDYEITGPDGTIYTPPHKDPEHPNAIWRWSKTKVEEEYDSLVFKSGHVYTKNYKKKGINPRSLLIDERFGRTRSGSTELRDLMKANVFDNPKPARLLLSIY